MIGIFPDYEQRTMPPLHRDRSFAERSQERAIVNLRAHNDELLDQVNRLSRLLIWVACVVFFCGFIAGVCAGIK